MGPARPPSRELFLRAPVIVGVLAATAIPIDLGSFRGAHMDFGWTPIDAIMNVAGYAPVGFVLASTGMVRAAIVALLMSTLSEVLQLGMVHRDPSFVDVACNVAGALVGIASARALRIGTVSVTLRRWSAVAAALCLVFVVARAWLLAGPPLNARGATTPGTLEAQWKLDEESGSVARDSSGHGLDVEFARAPERGRGVAGPAPRFDAGTFLKTKPDVAFRLVGSMTLAAWMNSSSFPRDDAVVVSTFEHLDNVGVGWQLDTTIDRGPRVIGFKLAGSCGTMMARYGTTPLSPNVWYHVAAVYDAPAQRMDVYLNGKLDDGDLVGAVEPSHRSSRRGVLIGRRGDLDGFEFAGLINDVRVYSRALSASEVAQLAGQGLSDSARPSDFAPSMTLAAANAAATDCHWSSERQDARLPALVVVAGIAMAALCAWALTRFMVAGLLATVGIGLVMFFVSAPTLPGFNLWVFPLTALAGGLSVFVSIRED